jgi:hypothetical protein
MLPLVLAGIVHRRANQCLIFYVQSIIELRTLALQMGGGGLPKPL